MTLRGWPRSLFGRILLVLALGLALAHALTFVLAFTERSMTMRRAMVSYLASDVASSMAMLDRLPAAERAQWVDRLARRNYRFALTAPLDAPEDPSDLARLIAGAVGATLPPGQTVRVVDPLVPGTELRLQLQLSDGTPLAVDMDEPRLQVSPWVLGALALQLALLVGLCAWAVRAATRPLRTLADAADALGADRAAVPLAEDGPREVQRAAQAFLQRFDTPALPKEAVAPTGAEIGDLQLRQLISRGVGGQPVELAVQLLTGLFQLDVPVAIAVAHFADDGQQRHFEQNHMQPRPAQADEQLAVFDTGLHIAQVEAE